MKGHIVVDTKETIWYRAYYCLEEEMTLEEFIKAVEEGEIQSDTGEYLYETVEDMSPEDNNNCPTMEIYLDRVQEENLIYKNVTK